MTQEYSDLPFPKMEDKINLPENLFINGFVWDSSIDNTPIDMSEVNKVRVFIKNNFTEKIYINQRSSSYYLKHIIERSIGFYVSNGTAIAAMILEGYDIQVTDGLNCFFNISEKSIKKTQGNV